MQPWARLSNEQSWQFEQIDLTHFRGRTLRIEFGVHNGGGRTALYLDEVSLLACEPDATPFMTPSTTSVAPHLSDAWIDDFKRDAGDRQVGVVGYEISFNRYFYRYIPPRALGEIDRDIREI